ncbi:sulfhydryl oxidase 2-like [Drosophila gunungcola]|uniref:sulfhydryl oxidase 2-like n=1 Tax=Drosophila gunungcola TaxID=103775 RepID=UPI0022E2D629|nr:sulfhydryl oxidase 2-like [Drosophila gunungcola]
MIRLFGLSFFLIVIARGGLSIRFRDGESLYSPDVDNVYMMNGRTFYNSLKEPALGKLVQFMNIFCGDCRRFVPVYKKLGVDLQKWNRVLRIYAVDCAQEVNVKVCRDFEIVRTPSIRFYPSNFVSTGSSLGTNINTSDPEKIVEQLIDHLAKNDYTGTKDRKPIFQHIQKNENAKSIFDRFDKELPYILLVLQPQNSKIGIKTVLDLLPYPDVAVRILDDTQLFSQFGLEPAAQKIALLDRSGKVHPLTPGGENSSAYVESVVQFLEPKGHTSVPKLPTTEAPKELLPNGIDGFILDQVLNTPPKLYQADLEQALDQILHIEIPKTKLINGYKFTALRHLIRVFNRFSPLNKEGKRLLKSLVKHLTSISEITGEQFADKLKEIEKGLGKIFKGKRYVGCLGSKTFTRGIPCSFWTLFHYLTVMSALKPKIYKPKCVLLALFGFAKFFFGCSECAMHFQAMAKRRKIGQVKSHDEEILWLWAAHNEVNKRLAGDPTEDPKFPKKQFPQCKHCRACRCCKKWKRPEVLKYLKGLYNYKNVSFFGLPHLRYL